MSPRTFSYSIAQNLQDKFKTKLIQITQKNYKNHEEYKFKNNLTIILIRYSKSKIKLFYFEYTLPDHKIIYFLITNR